MELWHTADPICTEGAKRCGAGCSGGPKDFTEDWHWDVEDDKGVQGRCKGGSELCKGIATTGTLTVVGIRCCWKQ